MVFDYEVMNWHIVKHINLLQNLYEVHVLFSVSSTDSLYVKEYFEGESTVYINILGHIKRIMTSYFGIFLRLLIYIIKLCR